MNYQIRVRGHLDPKLSGWFGDFTIVHTPDGDSLLTGIAVDQAALYGVLARCRDMGLTLISLKPIGENKMSTIQVAVSDIINARPEEIYAVISDYHVGHPAILPQPYFTGLTVEKGGQGAGTIVHTHMKVWGKEFHYRQLVTEPEPGRLLVETDMNTGQFSSFTIEPLNGGKQARVTITAEFPQSPGLTGLMEKLMQPPVTRRIFKAELQKLAVYLRNKKSVASPN